jgi:CheY-like chemotaxis protein
VCLDDDDGRLDYQRVLLERLGYTVLTAASAQQGLQIAAVCGVAAVIVDYHMPEMNGPEVAIEIKRLKPKLRSSWFPAMTSYRTRIEGG